MNIRILFSLLIFSIFSTKIFAELRLSGYYINKENDTIKAVFFVSYGIQLNAFPHPLPKNIDITLIVDTIDFINLTFSTTIVLDNGKWKKLKAKNIKAFWFTYKDNEYRFVSFNTDSIGYKDPNGRFVPNIFLREISKGKCSLYCYYEKTFIETEGYIISAFPVGFGGAKYEKNGYYKLGKNYYLKKESHPIIPIFNEDNFKNQIFEYFNNCEELRDLVYKTDLERRDIKVVVDRYNSYCK
jgi:hypothetical protein